MSHYLNRILCLFTVILLVTSCSDSNDKMEEIDKSTCEFIGEWCQIVSSEGDECLQNNLEFSANGQFIATAGNANSVWDTKDCMTIEISNNINSQTSTYEVVSIIDNIMLLKLGQNMDPFEFKRI